MVGYCALTQRNEPLALRLLEQQRSIVRSLLGPYGGREIKTIGDAFLVEFSSALAAVSCAIEIQQSVRDHNLAADADSQMQLRIGLHAGDIVIKEGDVLGDGVNIASRIEPLAEPGGICVTEDVARPVQNKLEFPLVKLGSSELKNIHLPVHLYRVVLPWQARRSGLADRVKFLLARKSIRRFALAIALAAGFAGVLAYRGPRDSAGAAPASHLAVLPLVNFSGDARDEYFADGLTEELISTLATIRELNVIARTSVTVQGATSILPVSDGR